MLVSFPFSLWFHLPLQNAQPPSTFFCPKCLLQPFHYQRLLPAHFQQRGLHLHGLHQTKKFGALNPHTFLRYVAAPFHSIHRHPHKPVTKGHIQIHYEHDYNPITDNAKSIWLLSPTLIFSLMMTAEGVWDLDAWGRTTTFRPLEQEGLLFSLQNSENRAGIPPPLRCTTDFCSGVVGNWTLLLLNPLSFTVLAIVLVDNNLLKFTSEVGKTGEEDGWLDRAIPMTPSAFPWILESTLQKVSIPKLNYMACNATKIK